MSREDGCDINVSFATQRNSKSSLPFVEMGYNGGIELTSDVLGPGEEQIIK